MERTRVIVRTSLLGILVNLILVAFKAAVGLISGSIAVILDAVNNLSDALSSVITIVGTKLAARSADKEHPYGHGRIEYVTSVLISVLVIMAGAASLRESVGKILSPTPADYAPTSLVIISLAVAAKFCMGRYVRAVGRRIHSGALEASGSDALFDSILSLGTLAAAAVSLLWGLTLEGVFAGIISLFILRSGLHMLHEALNSIIGQRADKATTDALVEKIASYPGVLGVYDMALHNYGPSQIIGSAHIEVAEDMTARDIHKLTRAISADVYMSTGILLTLGIYASNASTPQSDAVRAAVDEAAARFPQVLQVHGFYLDEEQKTVTFDLIVDFEADGPAIRDQILSCLTARFPQYRYLIVLDSDYSG